MASFHRVSISSPDLPRPVSSIGGTIRVINNQLRVEGLEGRVGRKGRICVRGKLPLRANETSLRDSIELKTDFLEVRAKNTFRCLHVLVALHHSRYLQFSIDKKD